MEGNMPQGQTGEAENSNQSSAAGQNAGASSTKTDIKGLIGQLEALLDEYMVKKAPFAIPMGGKEVIVKVAPYLIIVFAILGIPAILAGLGLSAMLTPLVMLGGSAWGINTMISLVVSAIALVMEVVAVPGLFKRTNGGWRLVFYASIVSVIGNILSLNLVGGVIGALISWYILFQVKDMYKN